ncbi:MAG: rhodanese-like domain-containing protein [Bacteroidetes bacterium]|nr:rhodanese-like domain-containing protein [Bacteroidota bacterium]
MLGILKNLFGNGGGIPEEVLTNPKLTIVDVRTPGEYKGGHIKGSINIPLDQLEKNLGKLKGKEPIVLCCASGMRSGSAHRVMSSKGFTNVYNGGGWSSLRSQLGK